MSDETVTYEVADNIATITLNRPAQRNALNWDAYAKLEKYLRQAVTDPDARCGPGRCLPPRSPVGDGAGGILTGHVAFYAARRACTVRPAPGGARELQAGPL